MTDQEVEAVMNYMAANFFKRIVKEAQGEYRKFLRTIKDVKLVKKVIDNFAAKDNMPTLFHLRKAYNDLLKAKNPEEVHKEKDGCAKCNLSGMVTIIFVGFSNENRRIALKEKPMNFPWMYEQSIPCDCQKGRYYRSKSEYLRGMSDTGHATIMRHCAFTTADDIVAYYQACQKLDELKPESKDAIFFLNRIEEVKPETQKELDIM